MIKKVFSIMDMHCSSCAMRLEGIEDDLPGILGISASYHKQQLAVEFDELMTDEQQILNAVENLGYHVKYDDH